jgi:hypothetical protein
MAKSMTKGLQNNTHVSNPKWADPKLSAIVETKDNIICASPVHLLSSH